MHGAESEIIQACLKVRKLIKDKQLAPIHSAIMMKIFVAYGHLTWLGLLMCEAQVEKTVV